MLDVGWPATVAVVVALVVFVLILMSLPPGPASLQEVLVGGAALPSGAAAGYTASLAATVALVALVLVALALALINQAITATPGWRRYLRPGAGTPGARSARSAETSRSRRRTDARTSAGK